MANKTDQVWFEHTAFFEMADADGIEAYKKDEINDQYAEYNPKQDRPPCFVPRWLYDKVILKNRTQRSVDIGSLHEKGICACR